MDPKYDSEPLVDVRIPLRVAESAMAALSDESIRLHGFASRMLDDPDKASQMRADADRKHEDMRWLQGAIQKAVRGDRAFASPKWTNNGAHTDQSGASGNSSIVQVDSGKLLPWVIFNTLLTGLAIALAVLVFVDQSRTERETRMLEYYVMELDGKLMKQKIIDTNESWSAQKREQENAK